MCRSGYPIETFLLGGVTLLGWPLLILSEQSVGFDLISIKSAIIIFSILGALIFYQPHFISTYYFNYSRGKKFIKKYCWQLVIFPLLLFLILSHLMIQQSYHSYLSWIYLLAILGAVWHFIKQSLASVFYSDQVLFTENPKAKSILCFSLIAVSLYGLVRMFDLHSGAVYLFGFRTPSVNISFSIQRHLSFAVIISLFATFIYCLRIKLALRAYIPLLAHIIWFSQDIFLGKYFYLIPVFHGVQYIPYFIKRIQVQPHWKIKTIGLISSSILLVQLIPSLLGRDMDYLFPGFLLFINLHHFVMETITWRSRAVL